MSAEMSAVDVWSVSLEDKPGSLAAKLEVLANAGANLEFVIARRHTQDPPTGVVYVAPVSGAKAVKAAKEAGFTKTTDLAALRIDAADKPGLGAAVTRAIAQAGINLRGFSGAAIGRKAVAFAAFDSKEDAKKAMKALQRAI